MNKYLITYELRNDSKDYSGLYQAIKNISGSWWHYLDSTWIIKGTSLTAHQIFEQLKPYIDIEKDSILIIKIDITNKQGWLSKKAWEWLDR